MSHTCRDEEGNVGCISCYAHGEDQGVDNTLNVLRSHQVVGFMNPGGFICSCNPGVPVNYSDHIAELLTGEPLRKLFNAPAFEFDNSPLPEVSGHALTGESTGGFLQRCSCGAAVDDYRQHLNEVGCHCYTCNSEKGDVWWMVVCITCGNKRCPHAQNHKYVCTDSNAVGQVGEN